MTEHIDDNERTRTERERHQKYGRGRCARWLVSFFDGQRTITHGPVYDPDARCTCGVTGIDNDASTFGD